jgi:ferredoxin
VLVIDTQVCDRCGACISVCRTPALVLEESLRVDNDACTSCGLCARVCPVGALRVEKVPGAEASA